MTAQMRTQVGFTTQVFAEVDHDTGKIIRMRVVDEDLVKLTPPLAYDMDGNVVRAADRIANAYQIAENDKESTPEWQFGFDS